MNLSQQQHLSFLNRPQIKANYSYCITYVNIFESFSPLYLIQQQNVSGQGAIHEAARMYVLQHILWRLQNSACGPSLTPSSHEFSRTKMTVAAPQFVVIRPSLQSTLFNSIPFSFEGKNPPIMQRQTC